MWAPDFEMDESGSMNSPFPVNLDSETAAAKIKTPKDRLHAIVATQSFNGSFPLNDAFSNALGYTMDDLKKGESHFISES